MENTRTDHWEPGSQIPQNRDDDRAALVAPPDELEEELSALAVDREGIVNITGHFPWGGPGWGRAQDEIAAYYRICDFPWTPPGHSGR